MEELLDRVRETAAMYKLWSPGDTIMTALSGGPDSMALLHMLQQLAGAEQLALAAAHVNHGFRIEESAREAALVTEWCASIGIPLQTVVLNLPAYIEQTGMNAQAAAREQRYAFLQEAAAACGAGRIALGHHAGDQAETVLMRIIRGTSPGGLRGCRFPERKKNVELIRPLLRINKSELLAYCDYHNLPYSMDSSNFKRHYFRNKVRLDVIPYLEELNPKLAESLLRLSDMARSDDDYMKREAAVLFREKVRLSAGKAVMDRYALLELHVALQRRLIKLILNYLIQEKDAITYERIEAVREAAEQGSLSGESLMQAAESGFASIMGCCYGGRAMIQIHQPPMSMSLQSKTADCLLQRQEWNGSWTPCMFLGMICLQDRLHDLRPGLTAGRWRIHSSSGIGGLEIVWRC